jgi:galactokinase
VSVLVDLTAFGSRFRTRFGGSPRVFRAPGRVNLIGEHTDYNDGLVMPLALDRSTWVAAGPRSDQRIVLHSEHTGQTASFTIEKRPARTGTWRDYAAGVIAALASHGVSLQGADILVASDVPSGAGLSSSAAFEVAIAIALLDVAGATIDATTLARLCQRAENEVVGAECGIMDQYCACHARGDTALLLDCRTVQHQLIPLPNDMVVVACNSMVRHSIASGEYNRRRRECRNAVAALAARNAAVVSLRDVSPRDLDTARDLLDDVLFRRMRHIVTENARVEETGRALREGRRDALGPLMAASHASMRDDYEISCPEIDTLVTIASDIPGVYGTRMTGGGFGGCTVSLVHVEAAAAVVQQLSTEYEARTGIRPETYVSRAAGAAERIDVDRSHVR